MVSINLEKADDEWPGELSENVVVGDPDALSCGEAFQPKKLVNLEPGDTGLCLDGDPWDTALLGEDDGGIAASSCTACTFMTGEVMGALILEDQFLLARGEEAGE